MSKATEAKLSELHGMVSDVLCSQLSVEEELTEFDEDGNMVKTGKTVRSAAPATIAAAIKFLKDNNITSDIEKDEHLKRVAKLLEKKQLRSRRGDAKEAAQLYAVN